MEKISQIIPPSHRTKSMEVSRSQPGRPGAPAMGRPSTEIDRVSDLQDKFFRTTAEKALDAQTPLYKNTKENARVKIVDDLAKKFFESNPKMIAKESDLSKSEETLQNLDSNDFIDQKKTV